MTSLLDILRPKPVPQPQGARLVSRGMLERPVDVIERGKETQRRHWKKISRKRRAP